MGERQTEDLEVPGSIPGLGIFFEGAGTLESRGISAILDSIDLEESIYGLKRYAAEDIVCEMAVPPLPALCSTVDIATLCCESLDFLEKPECLLHDSFEHLTRRDLKPKQVGASDDEWNKFGCIALERGLFAEVSFEDIFSVNGVKVLSMRNKNSRLEELFLDLTKGQLGDDS